MVFLPKLFRAFPSGFSLLFAINQLRLPRLNHLVTEIESELYLRQNTCAPSLPIRAKKPASTGDYFDWRFKPPRGVRVSYPITFNRWRARPLFCSGDDGNR